MEEDKTFYIDPVNRNIDIILGIVAIILTFAFFYMYYLVNENEKTKIHFDINQIENINWIDEENRVEFNLKNGNVSLSIDSTKIIDKAEYSLNAKTGEIVYIIDGKEQKEKLYLRSINNDNLTIWYNYAELHLEKEIEVK